MPAEHPENRHSTFFSSKTLKKMSHLFQSQTALKKAVNQLDSPLSRRVARKSRPWWRAFAADRTTSLHWCLLNMTVQSDVGMPGDAKETFRSTECLWKVNQHDNQAKMLLCARSKSDLDCSSPLLHPPACCWIVVCCKRVAFTSLCPLAWQILIMVINAIWMVLKVRRTDEQMKEGHFGWTGRRKSGFLFFKTVGRAFCKVWKQKMRKAFLNFNFHQLGLASAPRGKSNFSDFLNFSAWFKHETILNVELNIVWAICWFCLWMQLSCAQVLVADPAFLAMSFPFSPSKITLLMRSGQWQSLSSTTVKTWACTHQSGKLCQLKHHCSKRHHHEMKSGTGWG